jgi:hypothetical protein
VKSLGTSEEAQGRRVEIGVVRRVLPYLWPKGQAWVKWRVVIAVASLILAKLGDAYDSGSCGRSLVGE